MTTTIDSNVMLYASDSHSPLRERALAFLSEMTPGPSMVYLFWPTVMSYLRISTHPNVFRDPLTIAEAMTNIRGLVERSNVQVIGEGDRFWRHFGDVVADALPSGNLISDAHLVGLMLENGVRTIWTHDRDFRRFKGIEVRDPFA